MANKPTAVILILSCLFLPTTMQVSAGEQTKMFNWWKDTHKKRSTEQKQEVLADMRSDCEIDIDRWNAKLSVEPDSLYYQYKREQATKTCMNNGTLAF